MSTRPSKWDSPELADPVPGNVPAVLDELGVEIIRIDNNEVIGRCPAHVRLMGKQDRHPSWSVNTDTGRHNCFSCGFRGPFFLIVKEQLGVTDEDAIAWTKSKGSIDRAFLNLTGEGAFINELAEEITEADLALFVDVPDWACEDAGVEGWACDEYGILWDRKRELWITPVREWPSGQLVGWQEKGHSRRTFRNHPKHLEKAKHLFGATEHAGGDTAILIESPRDTARILPVIGSSLGLSSYGAGVSLAQLDLMGDMGIRNLISALDNDKAGDEANAWLIRQCRGRFRLRFWDYADMAAKDPGDQTDDEVEYSFQNAYPAIEWVPSWH